MYNKYYIEQFKGDYTLNKMQISNPLTIIGLFAGLSEVAMVTALPFVKENLQSTFLWFIMLFTVLVVGLFFWTLNKNPKVMYAPSDFKDENLFLENMKLGLKVDNISSVTTKDQPLKLITNKTFHSQSIHLDNHHYKNCEFNDCKIIYSAEGPIGLEKCNFNRPEWEFEGKASQTLTFLTYMNKEFGEGGKNLFEGTIKNIREGVYS